MQAKFVTSEEVILTPQTVCDQHVLDHNKEIKPPLKQNLEIHLTRMFNLKEFLKAKAYRPIGNCQTEDITHADGKSLSFG
jgi:hypothetical protein